VKEKNKVVECLKLSNNDTPVDRKEKTIPNEGDDEKNKANEKEVLLKKRGLFYYFILFVLICYYL
jgi:hypothetical protein